MRPMSDDPPHEFEIGDVFETYPKWTWMVTNRLVDVDTGDVLYRITGKANATRGESEYVTESTLKSEYNRVLDDE